MGRPVSPVSTDCQPVRPHNDSQPRETPTPWTLLLLTFVVAAYGALLLVAAEGSANLSLWAVAAMVSLTQAVVLTLVLHPAREMTADPSLLWGVLPPLLATAAIRLGLVRQAPLRIRWATAGAAWLVTLGPIFLD